MISPIILVQPDPSHMQQASQAHHSSAAAGSSPIQGEVVSLWSGKGEKPITLGKFIGAALAILPRVIRLLFSLIK